MGLKGPPAGAYRRLTSTGQIGRQHSVSACVRAALLGNTSVSAKQPSDWEDYMDFQALRDRSKEINPSNWSYGCFLPVLFSHLTLPTLHAHGPCISCLFCLRASGNYELVPWRTETAPRWMFSYLTLRCHTPALSEIPTLQSSKTQNTLSRQSTMSTTTTIARAWRLSSLKDLNAYCQDTARNSFSLGVYFPECMAGLTYSNQRDR